MCDKMVTYYKHQLDVPELVRTLQDVHGYHFDDPVYICDLSNVIENFAQWKQYLPRIRPYYAVKCNTFQPLLELLVKLGAGYDCASLAEISKIQSLGVSPNDIIFANTFKKIPDLLYAKKCGIKRMTFDNECELLKVKKYYPDAELVLRIRCDAKNAFVKLGAKCGCDPETEAYELIELAVSLNIRIIGISFHVGSGCLDVTAHVRAITAARKLFDYAAELGKPMNFLDIGGGFISDLRSFSQLSKAINLAIQMYFPSNDVTIIAEPGRYFASSAFTIVSKVINVKKGEQNGKTHYSYTINSGMHSGFRYMFCGGHLTKPELIRESNDNNQYKCTIWGPTCDSADKLHENIYMPVVKLDDILIFRNFGAYSLTLTTDFNGFPFADVKTYLNVKHEEIDNQTKWVL